MLFRNAALAALASFVFCSAQSVDIKGVVKDAAGAPLAGVALRLDKTGYQTLSGSDGSFTLNAQSTAILAPAPVPRIAAPLFAGNSLLFAFPASTSAIRLDGRSVFPSANIVPTSSQGSSRSATIAGQPAAAKTTESAAGFKDILSAGKTGFLTTRIALVTPTASGLEVKLLASAGILKDADGNEYQTIKIGNQVWMAEHLRTTKYTDGTAIPRVQEQAGWANRATPAYCSYNGMANADSLKRFGLLYNWHTINTKKLAPEGWHVPAETDWMALQNYLIGAGFNFDGTTSGNKIGKSMAGMTDWATSTKAGAIGNDQTKNNKSGFGGVPTGFRDQNGGFTSMGTRCIMHATNTKENTFGYFADLDGASETLRYSDDWMSMGFLVRLVKN